MGRIMALDYGMKRTGIAVTDPLQIIGTALAVVDTPDLWSFIEQYCLRETVDGFVLGDPKNLRNEALPIRKDVEALKNKLEERYPGKPVRWMDERFTSRIAQKTLLEAGIKKMARRKKSAIDQISAVLILQSYLDSISK